MKNFRHNKNYKYFDNNIEKTTLKNGFKIITKNNPYYNSFAMGVFVNVGSRDDFSNKSGLAHLLEHILFKKTKKYNYKQIAEKFEEFGAYYNAFTTQENLSFYVRALTPHYKKSLNILFEIIFNTDIIEEELIKEKKIILEEIKSYEDDYEEYIMDCGDKSIFGNHPLGNPILGNAETLENINLSDLLNFYNNYVNPSNSILCVVGNIEHNSICNYVEKIFDNYSYSSLKNYPKREVPIYQPKQIREIIKHTQQTHLLFINKAISFDSEDKYIFHLFNLILSEGNSSQLYQILREKYALVYNVYSSLQLYSDSGTFSIYTAFDYKNIDKIKNLIFDTLVKLNKINEKELTKAKEQLITGITLEAESLSTQMQNLAKAELNGNNIENLSVIKEKILIIEKQDILRITSEYLVIDDFHEIYIIPKNKN